MLPVLAQEVRDAVTDQVDVLFGDLSTATGLALAGGIVVATYLLTRYGILHLVASAIHRTSTDWDDRFLRRRAPHRLAFIPAAVATHLAIGAVAGLPPTVVTGVQRSAMALVAVSVVWSLFGVLDATNDIYERHEYAASRPIKGYVQLGKLLLAIVALVMVVAIVADRSPLLLLSGLGAATAVLLLVFRDTILSLVASVQLGTNDMVRVGDWITIDAMGIDGDVLDIALHTITIRNFDMTYGFVPTHELISTPFRNWRGMREVEGRRIMRSLHIDLRTIRQLADQDRERFRRWSLIGDFVDEAETNLTLFRWYALAWLRTRDDLHVDDGFPMMIRMLDPTPHGQPVEVYAFSKVVDWVPFEYVQATVFDHLLTVLDSFDLQHFQAPTAGDFGGGLAVE